MERKHGSRGRRLSFNRVWVKISTELFLAPFYLFWSIKDCNDVRWKMSRLE